MYTDINMASIHDTETYLSRMSKPLAEKLKIVKFFPENATNVLDVGCADGVVTIEMARMFPEIKFVGIDLNAEFIERARERAIGVPNISFECVYLREMLSRQVRFDGVTFCSVLHEFASYGEGVSSVVKALADAHEILNKGGRVIIRDMIYSDYKKHSDLQMQTVVEKIRAKDDLTPYIADFEHRFGKLNDIYTINHFLLKYRYTDNWEREGRENYVPVTFDQYEQIFDLLSMRVLYKDSLCLSYFHEIWKVDFGFTDEEMLQFRSTGIFVSEK